MLYCYRKLENSLPKQEGDIYFREVGDSVVNESWILVS